MGGQVKGENGINGGQDRTEGNMVSLSQHNYYGSVLHGYTFMTHIELLVLSMWMGKEGGRKRIRNSKR